MSRCGWLARQVGWWTLLECLMLVGPPSLIQAQIKIYEGIGRPKALLHLLAGDQFAGASQKQGEDLERLFLKSDLAAVSAQFSGFEVDLIGPKTQQACWSYGLLHRNPCLSLLWLGNLFQINVNGLLALNLTRIWGFPNLISVALVSPHFQLSIS